ncbi:hypothetical protein NH340_JMT03619 [Sarcoptes scabiei]|nr:hypothetical protein NH340_JMT03619 [Sarcoptes scabiei]
MNQSINLNQWPLKQTQPSLNITCDNERNSIIASKKGSIALLKCCSELLMCDCMMEKCEKDSAYKNDPWCKRLETAPCRLLNPDACQRTECDQLESQIGWIIILMIALGIIIAAIILILIIIVTYKKFLSASSRTGSKKSHHRTQMQLGISPRPNIDSVVIVSKKTSNSKSLKRESRKQSHSSVMNLFSDYPYNKNGSYGGQREGNNKQKNSFKISRSTLERAVS